VYISYKLYNVLFVEDYVLDNIFVDTILYVHVYLWIEQYIYCQCMVCIADLCLILLFIIKIGHAYNYCKFLSLFLFHVILVL
jgi:hypothetical protein